MSRYDVAHWDAAVDTIKNAQKIALACHVNPDGVAARTRGNARGVDLNRNFPYRFDPTLTGGYYPGPRPFSEPESRAVARISRRGRFDLAIWYHQPWGRTLVPCNGSRRAARRYARLSGLAARGGCGDHVPGGAVHWQHDRFRTAAFVVELPGRKLRRGEVRRHARAVARLGREIGARRSR
jgi:murein peptide amidase A